MRSPLVHQLESTTDMMESEDMRTGSMAGAARDDLRIVDMAIGGTTTGGSMTADSMTADSMTAGLMTTIGTTSAVSTSPMNPATLAVDTTIDLLAITSAAQSLSAPTTVVTEEVEVAVAFRAATALEDTTLVMYQRETTKAAQATQAIMVVEAKSAATNEVEAAEAIKVQEDLEAIFLLVVHLGATKALVDLTACMRESLGHMGARIHPLTPAAMVAAHLAVGAGGSRIDFEGESIQVDEKSTTRACRTIS